MDKIFLQEGFLYRKSELLTLCGYNNNEVDQRTFNLLLSELKRKRLIKSRRKKGSKENSTDDASLISEEDAEFDEYIGTETEGIQYLLTLLSLVVGTFTYSIICNCHNY